VCRATCMARVPVGQPCVGPNGSGDSGLCALGSACVDGRCKPLPGLGENCTSKFGLPSQCAQGLWCVTVTGEPSLGCRRVAEGSPCEMTKDCPTDLACVGAQHDNAGHATLGHCQPGFPLGTTCNEPVPCASHLVCSLVDPQKNRSECRSENEYCGGNVYCSTGMTCAYEPARCIPSLPYNAPCVPDDLAAPCGRDEHCARTNDGSNRCLGNARRLGDACEAVNACEAGTFCGDNAVCTKYRLPGENCVADGDCGAYDAACRAGLCVPCQ